MPRDLADLRVVSVGLDHPECVTVGPDGTLWAGGEAGQVYRVAPGGGDPEEFANVGGFVLGLCCDGAGAVYTCDWGNKRIARVDPDGAVDTYCDSAGGAPLICPNYNAFAADGSMWLSDSGAEPPEPGDGRLLRIPPGGGDAEVIDVRPLNFPNGLAVAADGAVFVVETFYEPGIVVYRDGDLSDYASLPRTCPDGAAIAATGALYVSCFQPHTILRIPPGGGDAETFLDDWMGHYLLTPTNIVFAGDGLRSLVIASIGGWALKSIDMEEGGAPLFYPSVDGRTG